MSCNPQHITLCARAAAFCGLMMAAFLTLFLFLALPQQAYAAISIRSTKVADAPLWLAEDYTVPVVHIILTFESAGLASDSDNNAGRAQLAAALLDEGAGAYDSLAFQRALESHAIGFSAVVEKDDLVVSIHSLKDQLPKAIELATLALSAPRFDADALAQVRDSQLSRLKRAASSPGYLAGRAFVQKLYGNHAYARDPLGTVKTLQSLSAADLSAYQQRYITQANLQIAAAGAISKSDLKEWLKPLVAALPEAFFPERDLAGVTIDGKGETLKISHASPQSVVMFGGKGIARKDKDFYAAYMMNEALGSGELTSRLMQQIRRKKGLVYSISTVLDPGDAADVFVGQFSTKNATVDEAIAAVKAAVLELATHGLGQRECRDLRQEIINRFALKLDSTEHVAQVIASMMRFDLGEDYLEKRARYFEAVSCDDVKRIANQLLDANHWLWVVVGGDTSIESPEPKPIPDIRR